MICSAISHKQIFCRCYFLKIVKLNRSSHNVELKWRDKNYNKFFGYDYSIDTVYCISLKIVQIRRRHN